MKILLKLLLSSIPLFLLSGCWGKDELEQRAYVVVLGLDKREDGYIDVTFQIANPQVGSSDKGASQTEEPADVVTIAAPDILSARELANSIVPRELSFAHLRTIIVSEELAKTELFHHVISSSVIDPEMRLENNLLVSKEKAHEFIDKNKPKMETRPHKYYQYMSEIWKESGYVPISDLNKYFTMLTGELYLVVYTTTETQEESETRKKGYKAGELPVKEGDPAQMLGSAVFKHGKMIGTITGDETKIAELLKPKTEFKYVAHLVNDPMKEDYQIPIHLKRSGNPKITINTKAYVPEVKVMVPIVVQIFSNPSLTDYTKNLKNQDALKKAIKQDLEAKTKEFIKKTQEEYQGEPFEWFLEARQEFWTLQDYNKYNWQEKYKDAKVDVTYKVTIESLGAQTEPEVIDKKGQE